MTIAPPARDRVRVLFAVNSLAFLHSHRRPLVEAAVAQGWAVGVVGGEPAGTRDLAALADFDALGAMVRTIALDRSSMNPVDLWRTTRRLTQVYREFSPTLVHHITPKVTICGAIAARRAHVPANVAAISGLGFLFAGRGVGARLRAVAARQMYSFALRHPRQVVIVQNDRDRMMLEPMLPARTRFVRFFGSGVDLERFAPHPLPDGVPLVLMPARMLRDKGVVEFAEAARLLRERGVRVRLVLCGAPDPGNPSSLTETELRALSASTGVEYWGFQSDIPGCLRQASIVCLPSAYGEGLPLALAEGAACGRAIITTDTPGCRDTVRDGISGRLLASGDRASISQAITGLLADPARLAEMGRASRRLAEERFSIRDVTEGHLAVYHSLIDSPSPS